MSFNVCFTMPYCGLDLLLPHVLAVDLTTYIVC